MNICSLELFPQKPGERRIDFLAPHIAKTRFWVTVLACTGAVLSPSINARAAQELIADGQVHRIGSEVFANCDRFLWPPIPAETEPQYHDNWLWECREALVELRIPDGFDGQLFLTAKGGDGGTATLDFFPAGVEGVGGRGVKSSVLFNVGLDAGEIPPGSTLRLFNTQTVYWRERRVRDCLRF